MKKIYLILAIIRILTSLTILLPAVSITENIDNTNYVCKYYGYEVTFGKANIPDASGGTYGATISTSITFSVFAFLAYFLPLIVLLIEVLFNKKSQQGLVILSVAFLASTIILVIITNVTHVSIEVNSGPNYDIHRFSFASLKFRFSYSTIIGGIVSLIGCFLAGFKGID